MLAIDPQIEDWRVSLGTDCLADIQKAVFVSPQYFYAEYPKFPEIPRQLQIGYFSDDPTGLLYGPHTLETHLDEDEKILLDKLWDTLQVDNEYLNFAEFVSREGVPIEGNDTLVFESVGKPMPNCC